MPTIVIRHPDGTTEEREVKGRLTVGCDEENDLVLRAGGVSQRHAQFFADGGELVLENVGSAAATIVDGETINAPRKLKHGVRVLIGEYEVSLKPDRVSVRKLAPVAALALAEKTLDDEPRPARQVHRKAPDTTSSGIFVAIGIALIGALGAIGYALMPKEPQVIEIPIEAPATPCANLEPQLLIAREAASERSLAAANAVLDCDPLNPEANALKRTIDKELKGAASAELGLKMIDLGRDDQALEALKEIPEGTQAFIATRPAALDAAERVRKQNSKDCLTYAREQKWLQAQPACEHAMDIACQGMSADALFKPADPVLIALHKAREVNDPAGPKWKCVPVPLLVPAAKVESPTRSIHEALSRRIGDLQIVKALELYAAGRINESITALQVVKEKSSKAAVHAQAESLRKDISNLDSLKKIADGMLTRGELAKAAKTYTEALGFDAKVITEYERLPSEPRKAINSGMAAAALKLGVPLARRPDPIRACAAFRLGFTFSKGNSDLNAQATACSTQAKAIADAAKSCADLDHALELAMPGDGIAEDIAAQKPQLNCR